MVEREFQHIGTSGHRRPEQLLILLLVLVIRSSDNVD